MESLGAFLNVKKTCRGLKEVEKHSCSHANQGNFVGFSSLPLGGEGLFLPSAQHHQAESIPLTEPPQKPSQVLISSRLDYCHALHAGLSQPSLSPPAAGAERGRQGRDQHQVLRSSSRQLLAAP